MGIRDMEENGMLILTRRVNETVMIGDEITVTVLSINNNQVRLGVNAPRYVPVPVSYTHLRAHET